MTMPAPAHIRPDHDEMLIARLAADDLTEREAVHARTLVGSCPACALLHADLRSIMAATAGLPAARRTRDFRLSETDAGRLRQTRWRRLLGRFGDQRLAFTRPLASGLVALGIAGLVLASAPSFAGLGGIGSAGAAPAFAPVPGAPEGAAASGQPRTDQGLPGSASAALPGPGAVSGPTAGPVGSPSPQVPLAAGAAAPSSTPASVSLGGVTNAIPSLLPGPPDNSFSAKSAEGAPAAASGPSLLLVGSVALLILGIALFLLRWAARRPA
jgi:hypothetical protein